MTSQADDLGHKQNRSLVERKGERELVATWMFDAPPASVYAAWSQPALFQRWWIPKSVPAMSLASCDMDVRSGGSYRLVFSIGSGRSMSFFGTYLDVLPNERIVWTNEEGDDAGAVTTVTFEGKNGGTLLVLHEAYPSKESLEEALQGSAAALPEQFAQLEELLATSTNGKRLRAPREIHLAGTAFHRIGKEPAKGWASHAAPEEG